MPRKARIDAPGALHHIIFRGIESTAIFKDAIDYRNFIQRLGNILEETNTPCFAWALLTNHAHRLLRTGLVPIATVMRRLLTGYAQQFNRRHKRHGHLFQNRYKSFLCEEDLYLHALVRYIHLNPIRAGMVKDMNALNSYPNSGHAVIFCCLAADQGKISEAEAARKLELSPSAVSKLANRGRKDDIASKIADRIFGY